MTDNEKRAHDIAVAFVAAQAYKDLAAGMDPLTACDNIFPAYRPAYEAALTYFQREAGKS